MSTATDTGVDLSLLIDLDAPIPCEHSQHLEYKATHDDGPGRFRVLYNPCTNCDSRNYSITICERFAVFLRSQALILRCRGCHNAAEPSVRIKQIVPL